MVVVILVHFVIVVSMIVTGVMRVTVIVPMGQVCDAAAKPEQRAERQQYHAQAVVSHGHPP